MRRNILVEAEPSEHIGLDLGKTASQICALTMKLGKPLVRPVRLE
jgi:hypothetical protein